MVKFRDLNNGEINSGKPGSPGKNQAQQTDSRLSFRKLAAEHKKKLPADETVSAKAALNEDQIGESGIVLYQKAAAYLKQVFEAVKRRKMFSLDPGFQIIREMVEIQSFQDALFIEALHLDDPLHFIIHNNVNVAIYAIKMAENLDFSKDRKIEIGMAGLMHDVGMALIPEKLIHKQERLSDAEFKIFKERQNYSYKILQSLGDDYAYLAECAVQVNERLDGSGYPQGLKGDDIHEYAQIIGLVDMYEALIHSRPQRVKFHHFNAVKEIIKSGKNLFQREHLKALLNIFSIFPLYSHVRLNSNAVGRVIETYPDLPMRPKIQIVFDSQQRQVLTERIVNLPDDPLLYIVDSVSDEELQSLSEGPDSEPRARADREKTQDDDTDATPVDAAIIDDELPLGIEEEDKTDSTPKTDWVKLALLIGAIALLALAVIIQYGNRNSRPGDADRFQTDAKALQASHRQAETTASGKPASDQGQTLRSIPELTKTDPVPTSGKAGFNTEAIKRQYPFSIKLPSFRSQEAAENSLAGYREKGLAPYWVKVGLGDQGIWYRVFAGYFEDMAQAEEIIKSLNLKGASIKKTRFATLIGTYQSESEANNRIRQILKQGFSPYVVKQANGEFYLYVGAFYTRKGAEDQYADLLAAGIKSKIVER
jgi:HD-GYP domain-containing protein (c-di-GMP phosphodiesterase class II)/cell division septation protein DedD